jgi:hypothetical protein
VTTRKSANRKKTGFGSKADSKCEVSLVGGTWDNKTICIVFPSPKYLVLAMGKELYERQDPDSVLDATYRHTDDWDAYRKHLREQALYIK